MIARAIRNDMSIPQRLPWFAFYPGDFISSTIDMSPATAGAYIRLLSHQWLNGAIPDDQEARERIAGGSAGIDWPSIQRRLVQIDGGWAHPRLLAEKERSNSIAEKRRAHIAQVNSRRSQRHSDCDNHCDTTTTTTTTSPTGDGRKGNASDLTRSRIANRERVNDDAVDEIISKQHKYLTKKLSSIGCSDSMLHEAWHYALGVWASRGVRPSTTASKLTENLANCRDRVSVVQYRMNQARQNGSGSIRST